MTKENIKKTLSHSKKKKSVFYQILRKKISILPNSKGKKSVIKSALVRFLTASSFLPLGFLDQHF